MSSKIFKILTCRVKAEEGLGPLTISVPFKFHYCFLHLVDDVFLFSLMFKVMKCSYQLLIQNHWIGLIALVKLLNSQFLIISSNCTCRRWSDLPCISSVRCCGNPCSASPSKVLLQQHFGFVSSWLNTEVFNL